MEEKAPRAEEVEGPEFPVEPAAREAPATRFSGEAAALGEREVGGVWVVSEKTPTPTFYY